MENKISNFEAARQEMLRMMETGAATDGDRVGSQSKMKERPNVTCTVTDDQGGVPMVFKEFVLIGIDPGEKTRGMQAALLTVAKLPDILRAEMLLHEAIRNALKESSLPDLLEMASMVMKQSKSDKSDLLDLLGHLL